ncbi:hypothetical protein ACP70R_009635 [Stipagrostis hirtigluma subsp. patula]
MGTSGEVGRYVLGPTRRVSAPTRLPSFEERFANGYLNESAMLWAEGRTEWMLLSSIAELHTAPLNDAEDDFEKFQKEVIQAEAEVEALTGNAGDGDINELDDERPATPPDGEEEFTGMEPFTNGTVL